MLTGRDCDTVQRAVTILAQQCMATKGFRIQLPQPTPAAGYLVDLTTRRYTTVASLSDAERYGFKVPPDEESHPDPDSVALRTAINPEEATALIGSSTAPSGARYRNGCLGVADRKLMKHTTSIVFDGLSNSPLIADVNDDPSAVDSVAEQSAMREFADCMIKAGYPSVTDPRQIPRQFRFSAPATTAEKTAAVSQFRCQKSSGVTAAMRSAEILFQLKEIDASPKEFAEVKKDIATVVRHATKIDTAR